MATKLTLPAAKPRKAPREAADYLAQFGVHAQAAASLAQESIAALRPPLAVALARSGRAREAEAIIAPLPDDNDSALRARALAAAYAGKHAASDALFARAVARIPSLPLGHQMWAEALLDRGDIERANEQAELANRKGPRWAEPLKLWGDALVAGRRVREAETKYAAAAERASRWGKLHLQWANALWKLGQRQESLSKLRLAAAMDLSLADAKLLRIMARNARIKMSSSN